MIKVFAAVFALLILFTGCGRSDDDLSRAMALREQILQSNGCSFEAVITADYGDKLYTFTMDCETDSAGNLSFTVLEPQTIAGITGGISRDGGKLTFDDKVLAFETMADGLITPVSAPWVFMHTLRSGYLSACGMDGENLKILLDDSYKEEALRLDVWVDSQDRPFRTEILWKGSRVLSLDVKNFAYV